MLLILLLSEFFVFKLFNIRVKAKEIPWSQTQNLYVFFSYIMKIAIVVIHLIDNVKTKVIITFLISFVT